MKKKIMKILAKKARIRGRGVSGTGKCYGTRIRPRLCVYKSNRQIYAQIINDIDAVTLVSMSSLSKGLQSSSSGMNRVNMASRVGMALGTAAQNLNIHKVKFDRNGYKYHGRVKSLANGARASGLIF